MFKKVYNDQGRTQELMKIRGNINLPQETNLGRSREESQVFQLTVEGSERQ